MMIKIVELIAMQNGAHRNQTTSEFVPDGWAVIPEDMNLENFPFGSIVAQSTNGVLTVTQWTPGTMPEDVSAPPSELEQLRADVDYLAVMIGVEME